jgi:hypothetical protein
MVGKVIKYYAYIRAPKLTYSVMHPKNAARLAKTSWDLKHAWAPRLTGAAAMAVALPLGYIVGKKIAKPRAHTKPVDVFGTSV